MISVLCYPSSMCLRNGRVNRVYFEEIGVQYIPVDNNDEMSHHATLRYKLGDDYD